MIFQECLIPLYFSPSLLSLSNISFYVSYLDTSPAITFQNVIPIRHGILFWLWQYPQWLKEYLTHTLNKCLLTGRKEGKEGGIRSQCFFIRTSEFNRGGDVVMETEVRVMSLLEGDQKPRNVGRWGKVQKKLPWNLQKEHSFASTLTWA